MLKGSEVVDEVEWKSGNIGVSVGPLGVGTWCISDEGFGKF